MATGAAQEGFVPLHAAHAIEQLIATVQFERPLDDPAMRAAIEGMARFEASLPGRNEIRGMGFQIGPQGVTPIASPISDLPSGIVRTLSDGRGVVVRELRVERQAIVFRTMGYTRWDAVWQEARGYLIELLPLLGETPVAAYALSYLDKFLWNGPPERCRPRRLLREGSPYLAPASIDATDLWHCHSGRFTVLDTQIKRLEVVNMDCVDEADNAGRSQAPERVVRISTTLTDFLNQPGFTALRLPAQDAIVHFDRAFPNLHASLLSIFSTIINDETSIQVGLNANAS